MSQQYSLRWNNHQPNFISMFTTLLNTQTLVDVTLAAEGKQLLAHKVVLSACSTYFQSLFVDNPSPHPIVILKDVTYADLRTMVDFMYCGEVNVTEEQLPKVLDTAKLLKIKGLTEMPDSTSLTRSQGTSSEFHSHTDSMDSHRHSPAPIASPSSNRRKRRRKSSSGSTSLNMVPEDHRAADMSAQTIDAITLSSLPQQRRIREYHEIRTIDNSQQTSEQDNLPVEPINLDSTPAGLPQGGQWTMMEHSYPRYSNACIGGTLQPDPGMYINNVINPHMDADISNYAVAENLSFPSSPGSDSRHRRTKHFKRQSRVPEDGREVRKQTSDPLPPSTMVPRATPTLQKYESYPQFVPTKALQTRKPRMEHEIGSLLIRAVTTTEKQTSIITAASASFDNSTTSDTSQAQRAKHTPAVRSGPPLSCNFCWNTVDECGRILRRKTQYHCPECRTNLCIVPCFHEYHEGPETNANTNAR